MVRAGEASESVLEATYGWYWAVDALLDGGAQVHLPHRLGVKMFEHRRVKNDLLDATDLADLPRCVWVTLSAGPSRSPLRNRPTNSARKFRLPAFAPSGTEAADVTFCQTDGEESHHANIRSPVERAHRRRLHPRILARRQADDTGERVQRSRSRRRQVASGAGAFASAAA